MDLDYAKLRLSKKLLSTIHPWWGRYFSRYDFHPMDDGTILVDDQFHMFANPHFVATSTPNDLAGAMHYALHWHLRHFPQRFPPALYPPEHPKRRFIPIACSMEVATSLQQHVPLHEQKMRQTLLGLSFTTEDIDAFHLTTTLPLPPHAWLPSQCHFPEGQSAEHYLQLLYEIERALHDAHALGETEDTEDSQLTHDDIERTLSDDAKSAFHQWVDTFSSIDDALRQTELDDYQEWGMVNHDDITILPDKHSGIPPITQVDQTEAESQLADDVEECRRSGKGNADGYIVPMVQGIITRRPSGWRRKLELAISRSATRASQSGMMDVSYGKRNPNQRDGEPLLPGLIMYPASFAVLVDISASMKNDLSLVMPEIMGIMTHALSKFGQPVTYVCADTEIQYAQQIMVPTRQPVLPERGSGGTEGFGTIIEQVARKGFRFQGRHYPKPDLLIVFTDGFFEWPFSQESKLLGDTSSIIMGCTVSLDDLRAEGITIPPWVRPGDNMIEITPGIR